MGSPFSMPELEALAPPMRRKLILSWLRGGVIIQFAQVLFLLFWILGGCMVVILGVLAALHIPADAARVLSLIAFAGLVLLLLITLWYFMRSELRSFVLKKVPDLYANLCVACGYDLRGSDAGCCPECGEIRVRTTTRVSEDQPPQWNQQAEQ